MTLTRRHLLFAALFIIGIVSVMGLIVNAVRLNAANPTLIDTRQIVLENSHLVSGLVEGDLVIAADSVTLAADSRVTGSVSVLSDSVTVSGAVEGDLTIFSDALLLDKTAVVAGNLSFIGRSAQIDGRVSGDLSMVGDSVALSNSSQVEGDVTACAETISDTRATAATTATCNASQWIEPLASLVALRNAAIVPTPEPTDIVGDLIFNGFASLLLSGIVGLIVTVFPRQISHIEEAIRSQPRRMIGRGAALIALGIGVSLAVIFVLATLPALGLVLMLVALIGGLVLAILLFAGWVTLSLVIGETITRRTAPAAARLSVGAKGRPVPPLVSAVIGSLSLSLVSILIGFLPLGDLIGLLVFGVVSAIGLGAALSTRIGMRPLIRSAFVQG